MKDSSMSKDENDAELARLRIERVQTEVFLWGGYRYSNARDAIAAAKRAEKQ
jgi:hypothetical protein